MLTTAVKEKQMQNLIGVLCLLTGYKNGLKNENETYSQYHR
jgi:hypothetical protein